MSTTLDYVLLTNIVSMFVILVPPSAPHYDFGIGTNAVHDAKKQNADHTDTLTRYYLPP